MMNSYSLILNNNDKSRSDGNDDSCDNSTFRKWLKQYSISQKSLEIAEKTLLSNIDIEYKERYINVGCTVEKNKNSYIWTLSFNEESTNTPLVLIHGLGCGVGLWILNFESLASNRPVYAFDIIGFGRSSRPSFSSDPFQIEQEFIDTIEAWRKEISLNNFILVGHSFGAYLSAAYAIKYPENINHLVFVDPWGFSEKPSDNRYSFWLKILILMIKPFNPFSIIRLAGPLGSKLLQMIRPDLMRKFSKKVNNAENVISKYLYYCNAQNPTGETAFHTLMTDGFAWAKKPIISRINSFHNLPITLIFGSNTWIDKNIGSKIKQLLPENYVNVKFIEGGGHHIYADCAEIFNDFINDLCDHVDKGILPQNVVEKNNFDNEQNFKFTLFNMLNVRNSNKYNRLK